MTRDAASQAQVDAARPDTSTWLGANAGSGKTRVLTDRVARLLLRDVPPERILCLTYTKAAASEMQNRLFRTLGEWAMRDDDALRETLAELGVEGRADLDKARALFAQAIEAPGGLKIQTIHAFCAAILRRFPLEAGVSPQFSEMEDRAAELLRARLLQDMADGPEAALMAGLARHLSDASFEKIARALAQTREAFTPARTPADLRATLGLPEAHGPAWVWGGVFGPDDRTLLHQLVGILHGQSPTMVRLAEEIEAFGIDRADEALGPFLADRLLTKALAPQARVPTVKAREAMGADWDRMAALIDRLAEAAQRPRIVATYEMARDLHAFAAAFLPRYAAAKAARGWLDFDDLILRTRDLLSDEKVAAWVLYRLDGGIDHILVDEAQDTSPVQWEVIERLAQEFTSGAGARGDTERTIFVVGDKKQSIYSFQGADPSGFDRMRESFRTRLGAIAAPFQEAALEYSFRSSGAILDLVDLVFAHRAEAGFAPESRHRAFHGAMPGRVDLWPAEPKPEKPPERAWTDTLDRPDADGAEVRLARKIASEIGRMLAEESLPRKDGRDGWTGRPVRPRDILILVQSRGTIFDEVIRACKQAGLPMAGADVLKVGAELAVRDLGALLSWLALPEDDLALATALRSPLFGWSEQDLFTLCRAKGPGYLWRALEAGQARHPATWTMLQDLRDAADFARPYDLIERVLIRHGGRARLLGRLGPEAEDGIDALLDQAIAYEATETPSLTGFLLWMQTDALKIKRQPDAASDQIRIMTVHGAKGLEAPIVFLPDCALRRNELKDEVMTLDGVPLLKPRSDAMPPALQAAKDLALARQAQERDRLLYVAMTRAEAWLIVAAAGEGAEKEESWHSRVGAAMAEAGAAPLDLPGEGGTGLRHATGDWPARPVAAAGTGADDAARPAPELPDWLWRSAPLRVPARAPLSPSGLGGPKALPGGDGLSEEEAMALGSAVHLWLEDLGAPGVVPDPADPACRAAQAVRAHPDFADLFGPGSLAEVTVSVPLDAAGRLRGTIDRLVVRDGRVLAVDYKTNAVAPERPEDVPEGLLRQMGAYAAALAPLYPGHAVETAILWTRALRLMPLPADLTAAAFARATSP